jgi:amino acid adenylation domain-containing protein
MYAMTVTHLAEYLETSAAQWPDRTAVVDPAGWRITYHQLNSQADALAGYLVARGVEHGDRVGVVLPKSVAAVVSLFGIMKAGAAYVPVDYTAPAERGKQILSDCQVKAVVVDERCRAMVPESCVVTVVPGSVAADGAGPPAIPRHLGDLAYILYTSGSTGIPKGVMLTHENAVSFVDWCSTVFTPGETDRFSSHAPFHFDLSILDIYVAIKHGATLFLISEDLGKNPKELAKFIAASRLTVWYSTPSILTLLSQFGGLESHDATSLRLVLFAGEVFPVKHLRAVQKCWPHPEYYNLYGPTETNVCTFARIPQQVPDDRETPYPIGFACSHCAPLVMDGDGQPVADGGEGLLYISGPSVFQGYWNRPEINSTVFLTYDRQRWYNTGDVVRWVPTEGYIYVGRRDRMVKRRGYRIELGEIERALYLHTRVREAAVISTSDQDGGVRIIACLSCHDGQNPSIVEMKGFCGSNLPAYMNPDQFVFFAKLPRTSTDKVDYQSLRKERVG